MFVPLLFLRPFYDCEKSYYRMGDRCQTDSDEMKVNRLLPLAFCFGICVCACVRVCAGIILYLTEPPGSTVLLEGVRGWQNCGLLATVMVSWQRKEEWHAENCKRSVRCEVAPNEGGKDCPGHLCRQCPAHTCSHDTMCLT